MTHDPIVAHLRSALDEVAAAPTAPHAAPVIPLRRGLDARRWVAIAASVVIVAGAAVGIAMYRGEPTKVGSPGTTTVPPTTIHGAATTMPYFLAAADLAPGPVQSQPGTGADVTFVAWARNGDLADGLIVMEATPAVNGPTVATVDGTTERVLDGITLRFTTHGLTDTERDSLIAQVVPGSGLPWILPVEGWEMVGMATAADGDTLFQPFGSSVTLSVGPMNLTLLGGFATMGDFTPVTVAGLPGWKIVTGGPTVVLWRDPSSGQWVMLSVPATMADRVDALILAVTTNISATPAISGDALPAYGDGADAAVGHTAPRVVGRGLDGNAVVIDAASTQRPTLVVFVANWCPHCHAFLPNVKAWIADGTIPSDVDIVLVTTAERAAQQSSAEWLAQLGWTGTVLVDGDNGSAVAGIAAVAYGATGYPFLVLINSDGTVAARTAGELSAAQMTALLATAA